MPDISTISEPTRAEADRATAAEAPAAPPAPIEPTPAGDAQQFRLYGRVANRDESGAVFARDMPDGFTHLNLRLRSAAPRRAGVRDPGVVRLEEAISAATRAAVMARPEYARLEDLSTQYGAAVRAEADAGARVRAAAGRMAMLVSAFPVPPGLAAQLVATRAQSAEAAAEHSRAAAELAEIKILHDEAHDALSKAAVKACHAAWIECMARHNGETVALAEQLLRDNAAALAALASPCRPGRPVRHPELGAGRGQTGRRPGGPRGAGGPGGARGRRRGQPRGRVIPPRPRSAPRPGGPAMASVHFGKPPANPWPPAAAENPHAAKAQALLALYLGAETDEELARARRTAARIVAMTDQEVAALGSGGGAGPERYARRQRPVRYFRPAGPFTLRARRAAASGDDFSADIYMKQALDAWEM